MKKKVCGFLVLVIEEICVMEEREEWNVSTRSGGEWDEKCLLFFLSLLDIQFGMTFKTGTTWNSHQYVQGKKKKKKKKKKEMKPFYFCLLLAV